MFRSAALRRPLALIALGLFLLGNNFCLVNAPLALACPMPGASASVAATPAHACCAKTAAASERSRRDADATRQATAPCCVAVSPMVAPVVAVLDAAPMTNLDFLPVLTYSTGAVDFARTVSVEVSLPPPARAATPAAGRAPPRR